MPPAVRGPALVAATAAAAALLSAGLAGLAAIGSVPLAYGLVLLQALAGATWLIATDAPFPGAAALLVGGAGGVADALVLADHPVGDVVGVIAVTLVLAVLTELVRRERRAVVVSLAATMSGVVFSVLGSALLAMRRLPHGPRLVTVALLALALGAAAAAVLDGSLAVLATVGIATASGAGIGALAGEGAEVGAALGGVAAIGALAAGIAVAVSGTSTTRRRRAACRTLSVVLPPLLAAPAAYATALVLTG